MEENIQGATFLPLLTASVLAFFAPIISRKIRRVQVPAVVTTIVLGVIFGPHLLGLLDVGTSGSRYLGFLADLGFIFLMFMAGLEIDFERLWGLRKSVGKTKMSFITSPLFSALAIFLGPLLFSYFAAFWMKDFGFFKHTFLFALLLSTISVGVVVPTLKDRGEIDTLFGQTIVVGALLADFGTLILFTGVVMLQEGRSIFGMLVYFILGLAFILFYLLGRRLMNKGHVRELLDDLSHAAGQIKVRGSLALMLALVAISEYIGVEGILGGFLAGAIVSLLLGYEREECIAKLDVIGYGFFIPLFFVVVGAEFDLISLFTSFDVIFFVVILLVVGAVVKLIPALALWPRFGFTDAMAGGMLIGSRLSLCIAVSHIAYKLELISASLNSAVIIMAAVSSTVSPVLYSRIKKRGEVSKGRVIIAGAGRVGRAVIQRLNAHGVPMVVIDNDKAQLERLTGIKAELILGDCSDEETLRSVSPKPNDTFVALTGTDIQNRDACLLMKDVFGMSRLIARDSNPKNTQEFRSLGLMPLNLTLHSAIALENIIFKPTLYKVVMAEEQTGKDFFEVELKNPELIGIDLKQFPYRGNFLIMAVRRDDDILIPHGATELAYGDIVMFLATHDEKQKIEDMFADEKIKPAPVIQKVSTD